jgi:hypothetical protein
MVIDERDSKVLLDEFNRRFPHGFIGARRNFVISQIDNGIRNIPPAVMQIFQKYTLGELIQWYLEKRRSGEI